jgi:tRNA (cmo5U34)-methyltransferase
MNHFDEAAKTWDNNPINWERSEAIASKIKQRINLNPDMKALEFGAGTGILSFLLKDLLKEITMMDSSPEMVKVMKEKTAAIGATNLRSIFFDLTQSEYTNSTFDLIYTQMVLHHIADIPAILSKLFQLINAGGSIAIADLFLEDGSFHGNDFDGHKGFDPEEMSDLLEDIGFRNIQFEYCFEIRRLTNTNEVREYPVFIITANK